MKIKAFIFIIPLLLLTTMANAQLTGEWIDNNGACYKIRQVENQVFWFMDGRPRVINVFTGYVAGNIITGSWADLPGGNLQGSGTLALRIESQNRMVKADQTGNYDGSVWTRGTCPKTAVTPPVASRHLGCFRDQGDAFGTSGRDLSGFFVNDSQMTTDKCVSLCRDKGFRYAGTQDGSQCFCGNTYGKSGKADNCSMRCGGNANQTCGGSWANSVYSVD